MLKAMLELISNALGAFSNWFRWKSSGVAQHDEAEKRVSKQEAADLERRSAVNHAVHEGDEKAVNRIVNGFAILFAMVLFTAILDSCCGCLTSGPQTQYIAADRVVTCTTNESGRAVMWHVPPLVMEELLNSKLELKEIKHQNKVKEITK